MKTTTEALRELADEEFRLRALNKELFEALAFASSVIKCGELWTDTCEEKIGAALAKAREEQS